MPGTVAAGATVLTAIRGFWAKSFCQTKVIETCTATSRCRAYT